jgi:hypothetical protein
MEPEENVSNREYIVRQMALSKAKDFIMESIEHSIVYAKIVGDVETANFFKKKLGTGTFYRDLKLRDAVITNPATIYEYYDRDRGDSDPFKYNDKLEKELLVIKERISDLIVKAITEGDGEGLEEALSRLKESPGE